MKISVIIPVYNAEDYVRRAVESAIRLDACGEVVLVEDNSPDNALFECQKLCQDYENARLYRHPNNENRGPGPSRNLGVLKSRYELIAFLDADDVYLPNRFDTSLGIMLSDENVDGVYEPVDCAFQDEESQKRYFDIHRDRTEMLRKDACAGEVFECLMSGEYGYIHLNGLLLRKKAFLDAGMMPPLRLHEDTSLILKLSLRGSLLPGERERPVSTRLLHLKNTFTDPCNDLFESRYLFFDELFRWMRKEGIAKKRLDLVKPKYYQARYRFLRGRKQFITAFFCYLLWKWTG